MAKKVEVHLVDDLDGSEAANTVSFALDGRNYEIDLSTDNANRLRGSLTEFIEAARRAGNPAAPRATRRDRSAEPQPTGPSKRERTAAIRTWARERGHAVAERGRIPHTIVEAYEQEQENGAA